MNPEVLAARSKRLRRSFHIAAKPIGSACNLDCTYCYYVHKADLLVDETPRLSEELLETFVQQYIEDQDAQSIVFTWHGGEPTLLGIDFFRKVVELQQKHAGAKSVENNIQTNGLLLDESWCEFFKQHRFQVGLSIDGPKHLHDAFRVARGGEPSFDRVYRAAKLLQRYGIFFNTLTVVHSANARQPDDVYNFLTQELGTRWIQWLPCVERKDYRTTAPDRWDIDEMPVLGTDAAKPGNPQSVVTDWSVDPDDWGEFLRRTFDLWVQDDLGKVFVNWYESLIGQWMRQPARLCVLAEVCGRSLLVVEKDGSIYPCDRFVYPEYKLGNLGDKNCRLAEIAYAPRQRKFGCRKRDTLPDYCKQCEYRFACNGGCPIYRFLKTPDGQPGLSYLCSGFRKFLAHADPYLRQIVGQVQQTLRL